MSTAVWRLGDSCSPRQGSGQGSLAGRVKPLPVPPIPAPKPKPLARPLPYVPVPPFKKPLEKSTSTSGATNTRSPSFAHRAAPICTSADSERSRPAVPWESPPAGRSPASVPRSLSVGARPRPTPSSHPHVLPAQFPAQFPLKPLPAPPSSRSSNSVKLGALPEGYGLTKLPTRDRPVVPSKPHVERKLERKAESLVSFGHSSPNPAPNSKRPSDYIDYMPQAIPARTQLDLMGHAVGDFSTGSGAATTAGSSASTSITTHDLLVDLSSTSDAPESGNIGPLSAQSLSGLPPSGSAAAKQHSLVTYAQPPPREMEYLEREHPKNMFEYLDQMRMERKLCDVVLMANEKEIHAHKVVLAACSQYFEQMFIGEFSEPEGEPIYIDEVEEDALVALVQFAYTCRIKITDRNIYSVFAAADLLRFVGVKSACFKFFKQQINKSNCIRTWLFAESHNCTELIEASLKYLECHFLEIVRGREFMELDQPDVVARIVGLEDLAITSEEQVYEGVLGWLQFTPDKRKHHAATVLENVRFPSMSRDYLLHIVDNEVLVKEDPDCLQQLIDALQAHVSTSQSMLRRILRKQKSSGCYTNVQPRSASMAAEVVTIHRGNGFLGLRIMGGKDRPFHVFRQGDKPGIFILKVTPEGAAAKSGKLRSGDHILKVNDEDVSSATHDHAIRLLKISPDTLTLLVRHEPPPLGLRELTLVTKPGEGFGFAISGGMNSYPGNPLDETDEGIFISQIIPGGAAAQDGRLVVGTRILQVNSVSLLGKSHGEALQVLQGVLDRINLLVCDGYDPDGVQELLTIDTMDEFGYVGSEALYERAFSSPPGGDGETGRPTGGSPQLVAW